MLPSVIRTSFPVFYVIFRLWKCSCSTRINKSLPLTLIYCCVVSQGHHSGSADEKLFAYSEIQKAL